MGITGDGGQGRGDMEWGPFLVGMFAVIAISIAVIVLGVHMGWLH